MKIPLTALLLAVASIATDFAPTAHASTGYELSTSKPSRALPGPQRGLAVDQASHDIYVAIPSTNPNAAIPGQINRFNSDLTADGVFAQEGGFYTGVAVNPLTQGFYAAQIKVDTPFGSFGTPRMDLFSSSGASTGSFALLDAESLPPIATDSAGRVFYPYTDGGAIQIFNSAGTLQETITCSGCPGGSFGEPVSVATDSANNLYVADISPDRVIKLSPSGGSYVFASVIQSGRGATAVGVDPSTGDVLVGDLMSGRRYHIVAYNSSGAQFDDFGVDIFPEMPSERTAQLTPQMAVDGTTHKLYVGGAESFFIFEKGTIQPPSAVILATTSTGQLTTTLNASVNANGHAALSCKFELTASSDVGFASATSLPCPANPEGSSATALKANATGLSPESSYRYRVTATSNAGSVTSASEVFQTLPELPPTVTAEPPQGVTETAATIQGKVNPHGGTVSNCQFEFGTTVAYGTTSSCSSTPPPASTGVVVSRKVSTLVAGTAYHYRLVVTTNAGTVKGSDVEFTTSGKPSGPNPAPPTTPSAPPAPPVTTPPPSEGPITTPRRPSPCRKGFHRRKIRGKVRCVKKVKRHHKHRTHR